MEINLEDVLDLDVNVSTLTTTGDVTITLEVPEEEVSGADANGNVEVKRQANIVKVREFAKKLQATVDVLYDEYNAQLVKALEIKNAQSDCIRGAVGRLDVKIDEYVDEDVPGQVRVSLIYFDDIEEANPLHVIENMSTFIPPVSEDLQWDWLRGLVGGNHEYTTKIAVNFVNFSFKELNDKFDEKFEVPSDEKIEITG